VASTTCGVSSLNGQEKTPITDTPPSCASQLQVLSRASWRPGAREDGAAVPQLRPHPDAARQPVPRRGRRAHGPAPPGAKGLNLAIHDVKMLFEGLDSHYNSGSDRLLEAHSDRARERLWKAQQFSYWLTTMLQTPADADDFFRARKLGELNSAVSSRHGKAYPGWPTPAGPPQLRPN